MINIRFTADPIPADFTGTLQDFQDRFLTNLRGSIDETRVLSGQIGGPPPSEDVGPWLNGTTWHIWNGSEYVPSTVKVGGAGFVVQLGDYTTVGDSASIVSDRFQTLQDKDGVIALLDDVYVGRPSITLSGATPEIDWSLGHYFTQTLPSNIAPTMVNSQDGQEIAIVFVNNATSYTITWPTYLFWPSGAAPTQTASGTDMYIAKNVAGSIIMRAVQDLS